MLLVAPQCDHRPAQGRRGGGGMAAGVAPGVRLLPFEWAARNARARPSQPRFGHPSFAVRAWLASTTPCQPTSTASSPRPSGTRTRWSSQRCAAQPFPLSQCGLWFVVSAHHAITTPRASLPHVHTGTLHRSLHCVCSLDLNPLEAPWGTKAWNGAHTLGVCFCAGRRAAIQLLPRRGVHGQGAGGTVPPGHAQERGGEPCD